MPEVSQVTPPPPTKPPDAVTTLIGTLAGKIKASVGPNPTEKPEGILQWVATQDDATIRSAIQWTQPVGWSVAAQPLIDSLSHDQVAGLLAAIMAVFVQTM